MKNDYIFVFYHDEGVLIDEQDENTDVNQQILDNLKELNQNTNTILEIVSEDPTEESTEEPTELLTEEPTEEPTTSEDTDNISLDRISDTSADEHLYLSGVSENATLDDLYSMTVSIRNILLLFFLIFVFFKLTGALKNVLYRLLNK